MEQDEGQEAQPETKVDFEQFVNDLEAEFSKYGTTVRTAAKYNIPLEAPVKYEQGQEQPSLKWAMWKQTQSIYGIVGPEPSLDDKDDTNWDRHMQQKDEVLKRRSLESATAEDTPAPAS